MQFEAIFAAMGHDQYLYRRHTLIVGTNQKDAKNQAWSILEQMNRDKGRRGIYDLAAVYEITVPSSVVGKPGA